jgi:hypothetical protein
MAQGLILLVFIGLLVAFFTVRVRKRMGLGASSKLWVTIIVWAVLLGLVLWAASTH